MKKVPAQSLHAQLQSFGHVYFRGSLLQPPGLRAASSEPKPLSGKPWSTSNWRCRCLLAYEKQIPRPFAGGMVRGPNVRLVSKAGNWQGGCISPSPLL